MDQLQVVAVAPSYQACWEHDRQRWARNRTVTLKGVRPDSAERAESKTPVGGRPGNFSGKHDPLATTPHETMFDSARGEERLAAGPERGPGSRVRHSESKRSSVPHGGKRCGNDRDRTDNPRLAKPLEEAPCKRRQVVEMQWLSVEFRPFSGVCNHS